jgi:sterol desaturase/sphingolipid hydroxylase (fatty acid hydroxylase superfamily)
VLDGLWNGILELPSIFLVSLVSVLNIPLDAREHLYAPYLVASLLVAAAVYVRTLRRPDETRSRGVGGYVRFLFPEKIWSEPSAWVDVRYVVPHQMVRVWIYGPFVVFATLKIAEGSHGVIVHLTGPDPLFFGGPSLATRLLTTLAVAVAVDFAAYLVHYLQHKNPILWEFHRVHHSAVVLHPLTNYREHPVDNLVYALAQSAAAGATSGCFLALFGIDPAPVEIAGVSFLALLFNVLGYHLRHSHIWLRWPGFLAYVFGCPAHHQIHHSCQPEHIDKNLAFYFPIWDVLFGTFCLPKREPKIISGLGDGTEGEYSSFLRIYALPFARLYRRFAAG